MNSKIAALMPFVDFLGAALGSATEVVLHDLTEPENSVVKIVNGHVSGRNVGAPATDFARAIVREYGDSNINFVTDYVCKTVDGRPLQGSSYFVRDEGEVVGMICVNIDPQPFRSLEDALNVFMEAYRHGGSEEYRDANLDAVRRRVQLLQRGDAVPGRQRRRRGRAGPRPHGLHGQDALGA